MSVFQQMIIRRLGDREITDVMALMDDVRSRLPLREHYAADDEDYFRAYLLHHGEIYGAYLNETLAAYTVLSYPGTSGSNLGRDFGVHESELDCVAFLEGTIVHESVRGMGLQRHFHHLREERAKDNGCRYLYSTVHPDNRISINNLVSAGFTLRFTRPMYGGTIRHCYAKTIDTADRGR